MRTYPIVSSFIPRNARTTVRSLQAALAVLLVAALAACSTTTDLAQQLDVEFQQAGLTKQRIDDGGVTGVLTVRVSAALELTEVRFHVDDVREEFDPAFTAHEAPFEFELDTTTLADGPHTLTLATSVEAGAAPVRTEAFYVANETDGVIPDGVALPGSTDADEDAAAETLPAETVPVATLYVSPTGSASGDGRSADAPVSVHRAAELAQPGDVVHLRGGVYPIDVRFSRSGTASEPITWTSAPGEWAIFDGSDQTPISSNHKFRVSGASWNVFMNLEVRYGPQEGIYVQGSHDNVFRDLVTHGHQYSGIGNISSDRNLYEGITTYDNFDDQNPRGLYGDDADGIALSSGDSNVVRRVVTFNNSDDGIDAWRSTNTVIEYVVAYENGRGSHGNGNGIKAGGNSEWNNTIVRNSIAFDNKAHGFDDNSGQGILFENNTAYGNRGYSFMGGSTTTRRNNIAVGGTVGMWGARDQHNTWDLGIGDPRIASTDLNAAAFMTLLNDSPAIGAGVGGADLGAIPYTTDYAEMIGTRVLGPAALRADSLALR